MKAEEIKNLIQELLSKMNFPWERIEVIGKTDKPKFLIIVKDARLLIGKNGETFSCFTHLVRKLVENRLPPGDAADFSLDVNGYHAEKVREAYGRVQVLLDRSRALQSDVEMPPEPAYERMIMHEALADLPDIKTESVGEGSKRRVVIKYVKQK